MNHPFWGTSIFGNTHITIGSIIPQQIHLKQPGFWFTGWRLESRFVGLEPPNWAAPDRADNLLSILWWRCKHLRHGSITLSAGYDYDDEMLDGRIFFSEGKLADVFKCAMKYSYLLLTSNNNISPQRNCPPSWKAISNKPFLENNQTNSSHLKIGAWKTILSKVTFQGPQLAVKLHFCRAVAAFFILKNNQGPNSLQKHLQPPLEKMVSSWVPPASFCGFTTWQQIPTGESSIDFLLVLPQYVKHLQEFFWEKNGTF